MTPRVLPADVYDTLELSALAYGGIGAEHYFHYESDQARTPVCAVGHLACAMAGRGSPVNSLYRAEKILSDAGIKTGVNDQAVGGERIRLSFAEWCRRLNVVRGAA